MATLPEEGRVEAWGRLMSSGLVPGDISKPEFRAAIDAIDDLFDTQAATWNSTLPLPYRTSATAAQKYELFAAVATQRAKRLS